MSYLRLRRQQTARQGRSKVPGVSLLPFLAVLLCTMGGLVVLLVLVVQQAKLEDQNSTSLPSEASLQQVALYQTKQQKLQSDIEAKKRALKQVRQQVANQKGELAHQTEKQDESKFRFEILTKQQQELAESLRESQQDLAGIEAHHRRLLAKVKILKKRFYSFKTKSETETKIYPAAASERTCCTQASD